MRSARRSGTQRRANGKSVRNHAPAVARVWQPYLSYYPEKRVLTFATDEDLEAAIDLLWTDELRSLPHETPDGTSVVVPAEAVDYFARAGLRFTEERLRSIGDLSPEEIKKLRR